MDKKQDQNNQEKQKQIKLYRKDMLTVSVAESVSAGAICNRVCAEPGASVYFVGGIVSYNIKSKVKFLNVDPEADYDNFANPFVALDMATNVTTMFGSRIGLSSVGYSLPFYRAASGKYTELNITEPYAYVCLYDAETKYNISEKISYQFTGAPQYLQRANFQAQIAILAKRMYKEYCRKIKIQNPEPELTDEDLINQGWVLDSPEPFIRK